MLSVRRPLSTTDSVEFDRYEIGDDDTPPGFRFRDDAPPTAPTTSWPFRIRAFTSIAAVPSKSSRDI